MKRNWTNEREWQSGNLGSAQPKLARELRGGELVPVITQVDSSPLYKTARLALYLEDGIRNSQRRDGPGQVSLDTVILY